ncbi:MAG: sensor histidine kinase [Anaerolineae bacterium]|nr:sensor histidine kinase [Anaerolineae bacterium]
MFFAPAGRTFGEIELALLNSVADQIGVVIENAYLHKQAEELAVLEERNRLARELHDSVTQAIYSLTLFAEAGLRLIKSNNHELVETCLQRLHETSQQALKEMRLLLHRLRPPDLEEEGLVGALQQRLDAVEGRANVATHLLVEGDMEQLPEAVEEQIYRIAQEALNNALKHSSASLLTVRLRADEDFVEISIIDDGVGFDTQAVGDGGMGLQTMEERVEELDGELLIESIPGEGTAVTVHVDLDEFPLEEANDDIF